MKTAVKQYRDVSALGLRDTAELVMEDGIHILVDLMGFSVGERLSLFALKPAPVQVAYMGYPGACMHAES